MNLSKRLATHIHQVYFGDNWTAVHLQKTIADVTLEQATTPFSSCHTIAALVYHIHYFVRAATGVLEGKKIDAKDALSFDVPYFTSQKEWEAYKTTIFNEAQYFVSLVQNLPDETLEAVFENAAYGDYFNNLQGIIEHTHYHLGQIVIIKKCIS